MRRLFFLCLVGLLFFGAENSLAAEAVFFAGLGTEINANSPTAAAISAGLVLGLDISRHWALGGRGSFSYNTSDFSVAESVAFIRRYLLPGSFGPFIQGEAGCTFIFSQDDPLFIFTGALAAGWRFRLAERGFIESALRFGYPFLFGIGLTAGIRSR